MLCDRKLISPQCVCGARYTHRLKKKRKPVSTFKLPGVREALPNSIGKDERK